MKAGDEIDVIHNGRAIPGEIVMISENQVSAMIKFDAMIDGHAGMMPIMRHDAKLGIYRSIINNAEVTLRGKS